MTDVRRHRLGAALVVAVLAVGNVTGCGSDSSTPTGTLRALADAVNASDDDRVAALICTEARDRGITIAEVKAQAVQSDPKLAEFRYEAQAGPVTDETDTTAVGTLTIAVKGIPDDLSDSGRRFLDSVGEPPRPLSLRRGEEGRINLVKREDRWYACT